MRILVISDSHGRTGEVEKAIEAHPDIKHIFFLGDCVRDVEDLPYIYSDRSFHIVEGNCDGYTEYKSSDTVVLNSKRIFFTHGHAYSVKLGMERLCEAAKSLNADLVLYGHTHIAKTEYADGVYFVNPGSISAGRSSGATYAVIDLVDAGIMPNIIKVN